MKTVLSLAFAVLVSTVAFSQVHVGGQIIGSLNSGYFETKEEVSLSQKGKIGYGVGVVSELSISDRFALRPSLNFIKKGVKLNVKAFDSELDGDVSATMNANLNYLELPVVLAYNIPLSESKVYFGIGPSVGYGISGKSKMTYSVNIPGLPQTTETEKVSSFKSENDGGAGFKRLDASATALAGIQFNNGLFVNASGAYGLTNNMKSEDGKYQSRSVQLTVGFLLK